MSSSSFSRPGAVDLSAMASSSPGSDAAGAYVVEVASQNDLADVVQESMSVVVLVTFYNADTPASVSISDTLARLADEFAGRFLLARVDAAAHADLTQSIGVPSVPFVAAALQGRLAPLLTEDLPETELRQAIEQILQAAVSNGITGRAEPRTTSPAEGETEQASRFPEAESALMSGDIDAAITAYSQALESNPGDDEASVGLAQAKLMKRTQGADLEAARTAAADAPDDMDAQTLVADLDLMGGHVEDSFTRLVDLVRRTAGSDRDRARTHLVELFAVVGPGDERVAKGRQALANALF